MSEESFDPGRPDALQRLVERPTLREFTFFHQATLDGMMQRVERLTRPRDSRQAPLLHKITETFQGHETRLSYRSITFHTPAPPLDGVAGGGGAIGAEPVKEQIERPRKMAQKFERETSVDADHDVRKRTFHMAVTADPAHRIQATPHRICLVFHYGVGRITASRRTYTTRRRGGPGAGAGGAGGGVGGGAGGAGAGADDFEVEEYTVDPFARPMRAAEQREEYLSLIAAERAATAAFRDAQREAERILDTREKEERSPELFKSLPEQLRDRQAAEAVRPKEDTDAGAKYDYLTPFLPKDARKQPLTKQEAQEAKDACLRALKERLIDRAHIIETRLEEETAAQNRRILGYSRQQDKEKTADDEEYEKQVQAAQFRIQILNQRRERHEEMAKQKFKEMIERLQNDPRLSVL